MSQVFESPDIVRSVELKVCSVLKEMPLTTQFVTIGVDVESSFFLYLL